MAAGDAQRKHGAVPALPGDTFSSMLNRSARMEPSFIEERRKALEVWLNGCGNHTYVLEASETPALPL